MARGWLQRLGVLAVVALASLVAVVLSRPSAPPDASVGADRSEGAERSVAEVTTVPSAEADIAQGSDNAGLDATATSPVDTTPGAAPTSTPDVAVDGSTTTSTTPLNTTTSAPASTPSTTTTPATTTTSAPAPTTTSAPDPGCCGEGDVGLFVNAKSAFTPWLELGQWAWMDQNYAGMLVYESYWDNHIGDVGGEWVYKDSMAIYVDPARDSRAAEHPDWILREADGTPVYIDYSCGGGCPQYAADVANPAYRADFIAAVQTLVDRGYTGLMLDDVNLSWVFADVNGGNASPIDPRTGVVMTIDDWQRYMAEFLEAIRAAFPGLRIMHNVIWFSDTPAMASPYVTRQIAAADMLQLERGATDPNFPAGNGTYGFQTFLRYIDRAHGLGTDVVLLDEGATDLDLQEFNLAATLLVNEGGDYVSTENFGLIGPTDLWTGFEVDLGHALGSWYVDGDVLRRDFSRGMVVLNEPTRPTVTVELPAPMVDLDGATVSSVTLPGFHAAVLRHG